MIETQSEMYHGAMGEVRASVTLENGGDREAARRGMLEPGAVRRVQADLLVDTGAIMVLLPQDMVEALGLGELEKVVVTLANDEKIEKPIAGPLILTVVGRTMITDCLVGPPRCEPLLGQVVLERLDLMVDPIKRQLTVHPESPFLPSLKLK
jgi:clan AA aspartic protease